MKNRIALALTLALVCALCFPALAGATAADALGEAIAFVGGMKNYTMHGDLGMTMEAEGISLAISAKSEYAVLLDEGLAHGTTEMSMFGQSITSEQYVEMQGDKTLIYNKDHSQEDSGWQLTESESFTQILSMYHIPAMVESLQTDMEDFLLSGTEEIDGVECEIYNGSLRSDDSNVALTSIFGQLGMGGAEGAEPVEMPVEIALRAEDHAPVRISLDMSPLLTAGLPEETEEEVSPEGSMQITMHISAIDETEGFVIPEDVKAAEATE